MKPAAQLAGVLGACCAALLVIGLILLYANGFTTIMTFNHPGAGYEFAFVDVLAGATFARSGPSNVYLLAFNLVIAATFTPVGVLIASRNPRNSLGWLFCAVGLSIGLLAVTDQYAVYSVLPASGSSFAEPAGLMGEVAGWLASWIWCPEITFVFTLLPLLFPDGRPLTRRWWVVVWLAVLGQTLIVVYLMFLAGPFNEDYPRLTNPFGVPGATAFLELCLGVGAVIGYSCILASAVSLMLRLRRSRGRERQQIKWFVYAATLAALTLIAGTLVRGAGVADVPGTILQFAALPLLPIAIAVAILRHHLYDIDVLINRTLVYSALTASLALVYFGSIIGWQYIFRAFAGEDSSLAVVASTLLIAALFSPLRRGVQRLIDRRFYRRKYDARATLEEFGARLRDETALGRLDHELLTVVEETVQPEHVSLWLREPGR